MGLGCTGESWNPDRIWSLSLCHVHASTCNHNLHCCLPADVLFTDLPAPTPENEAQWQAQQPGFSEMLAAQVITLKLQAATQFGLGQLVTPEERRRLERYQALTSDKLRPTRDAGEWGGGESVWIMGLLL